MTKQAEHLAVPPSSQEAEIAVIGSIMLPGGDKKLPVIARYLKPEDFYHTKHEVIFRTMLEMLEASLKIDIMTVSERLEEKNKLDSAGGASYLAGCINSVIGYENVEFFAKRIHAHAVRRRLISAGHKIIEIGENTEKTEKALISEASSELLSISTGESDEVTDIRSIMDDYDNQQNEYAESIIAGNKILGISTGYRGFDYAIEGLRPHHLWTIAAFTSVGKSTFVLNIARNVLKQKKRVVFFSFEMSKEDITSKLLALELGWNPSEVMKGKATEDTQRYDELKEAKAKLSYQKLSIYTNLETATDIAMVMQSEAMKEKVDLFVVDYIQNISSEKHMDEYTLLTDAVKKLQRAISSIDATLILISQISIENQKSQNVLNINGKGSGAIRNASNLFAYLKNDGDEQEVLSYLESGKDMPMKCIINKNRQGRVLSFELFRKQETGEIYEPNIM